MKDITGPNNPNYRHGKYASWTEDDVHVRVAIAKATLRKILTTPFGPDGKLKGFTPEEITWAFTIVRTRPEWAEKTLKDLGIEVQP